jgi:uncharacterized protein YkwD
MKIAAFRVAAATVLLGAAAAVQPALAAPDTSYGDQVLAVINAYRISKGLAPLEPSPALAKLAGEHTASMLSQHRPSHEGFAGRFDRAGDSTLCVENVAHGFQLAEQVVSHGWRKVPTHHRNLLEPRVRYAGIVSDGLYVTFFACDGPGLLR